jgi:hypothetical protein
MAEYSKLYITNNGQALMAKMIAGSGNIDFTKVCSSSTQYTESQLQALTASRQPLYPRLPVQMRLQLKLMQHIPMWT